MAMGFGTQALAMFSGVIVWALHFAVIYGATGIACARGAPQAASLAVAAATAVAVPLLLLIIVRGWRARQRFESWLAAALGGFALLGVVWETLPALLVEACS
jgi:hypothetical protein